MQPNILLLIVLTFFIGACQNQDRTAANRKLNKTNRASIEKEFVQTLQTHLDAVSSKDLETLKSTLSPHGKMQLILEGQEIINSVDSFVSFHEKWFADTAWTFETKILNSEIGPEKGMAITELIYREADRDGEAYFNRMIVSYGLERVQDEWHVIKDHCTSIEKSTD